MTANVDKTLFKMLRLSTYLIMVTALEFVGKSICSIFKYSNHFM